MHFYFVFFTAHRGLGIFNINYTVLYSAICRPSDRTVGRPPGPGFGIQSTVFVLFKNINFRTNGFKYHKHLNAPDPLCPIEIFNVSYG